MENDPKSKLTDDEASQAGQQISESRMRQALGIEARSPDRHVTQSHTPGSHTQGAPRRRFVTDGDVPVVMIGRRRDHGTIERADQTATLTDRVTATEAALATERDARTRAEALLAEARHTIQHLQTLVAHADLARDEAVAHARRAMAEYSEMSKQLQEARDSQPPAAP